MADLSLQNSFKDFFPHYLQALKAKDQEFLKKVYPPIYFKLLTGDEKYNFEALDSEWILKEFDSPDATIECTENKCSVFGKKVEDFRSSVIFTFLDGQWLGYDVAEAEKMMKVQEGLAKFKYDYQISFAGFGPAKYEVLLNGKQIEPLIDYKIGHSISFVPFDLIAGENVLKVSVTVDLASPDYKQSDKQNITLSYEVFRFPKGNTNADALFDKNNILIRSGSPESAISMEEIEIGKEGFTREVKFNVE